MITSPYRVRTTVLTAVVTAALMATVPAATASPSVDARARNCVPNPGGGCKRSVVVEYWHEQGASQRGIGWVYASKKPARRGAVYYARWTYKAPGKAWKNGAGWKKANVTQGSNGSFAAVWWGRGGHTGPLVPKGTQVCTRYKDERTSTCLTLK
ncbi:hypothetical protein [Streptomyces sp. NPDC002825]|uniref:hypothetical protein n=1 Tax=Streptomyces sp. NPDC002825 TaxID=3154666 RepID=UPI003316A30A